MCCQLSTALPGTAGPDRAVLPKRVAFPAILLGRKKIHLFPWWALTTETNTFLRNWRTTFLSLSWYALLLSLMFVFEPLEKHLISSLKDHILCQVSMLRTISCDQEGRSTWPRIRSHSYGVFSLCFKAISTELGTIQLLFSNLVLMYLFHFIFIGI